MRLFEAHYAKVELILATTRAALHWVYPGVVLAEETALYVERDAAALDSRMEGMTEVLLEGHCR